MRRIAVATLLALTTLLSAVALAQDSTYRLRPLDVLHIKVYNEPQIEAEIPVGRDGNISAPFVGMVKVEGMTTSELEAYLTQEYIKKLQLRDPKVAVYIVQYRQVKASVTGSVVQPGVFPDFRPGDTIVTLLSRAGGAVPDRADLKRCTLRRVNSRELIPVDMYSVLVKGDTSQIYALEDGDELFVPEQQKPFVMVLGAVQQPGPVQYRDNISMADAISGARGPISLKSKMSEIYVIRRLPTGADRRIKIDFVKYIKKGDPTQNITLQPGDIVYVSETKTPDFNLLGSTLNSAFFLDRLVRDGFLGVRIFR
ncbi:MAG: polysaccharide biosynthesis/export family protein [Fimbriimonadales bacterium]